MARQGKRVKHGGKEKTKQKELGVWKRNDKPLLGHFMAHVIQLNAQVGVVCCALVSLAVAWARIAEFIMSHTYIIPL
jgi:hypothetical protein